jgi:hypothetical protein
MRTMRQSRQRSGSATKGRIGEAHRHVPRSLRSALPAVAPGGSAHGGYAAPPKPRCADRRSALWVRNGLGLNGAVAEDCDGQSTNEETGNKSVPHESLLELGDHPSVKSPHGVYTQTGRSSGPIPAARARA